MPKVPGIKHSLWNWWRGTAVRSENEARQCVPGGCHLRSWRRTVRGTRHCPGRNPPLAWIFRRFGFVNVDTRTRFVVQISITVIDLRTSRENIAQRVGPIRLGRYCSRVFMRDNTRALICVFASFTASFVWTVCLPKRKIRDSFRICFPKWQLL